MAETQIGAPCPGGSQTNGGASTEASLALSIFVGSHDRQFADHDRWVGRIERVALEVVVVDL